MFTLTITPEARAAAMLALDHANAVCGSDGQSRTAIEDALRALQGAKWTPEPNAEGRRIARSIGPVEFEPEPGDPDYDGDEDEPNLFAGKPKALDDATDTERVKLRQKRQRLHDHGAGGCQGELAPSGVECINPQCGWRFRL